MAHYFQLRNKETNVVETFAHIDNQMCAAFGLVPDSKVFLDDWYDYLGPVLSLGMDWDWCRKTWPVLTPHADWLEAHYNVEAWSGR